MRWPHPCLFVLFVLFFSNPLMAQEKFFLGGKVLDSKTDKSIEGASVSAINTTIGTTTSRNGTWKIELRAGQYTLVANFLGYQSDTIRIQINSDRHDVNFRLLTDTLEISSVQVEARARSWNLSKLDPGQLKLAAEELSKVPSLLGSQDPLNSLRALPGIQSVGEGTGYFYVRGGGADHNLIMIDDAIIYHPSHLVGLFSVVNPSVISSINLYKGGIPANYGNRLASVIDIETLDGRFDKISGEVSLGIIASRINIEGPLIKEKLSAQVAFRRTHLDLIYPLFMPKSNPFHGSGYAFSDFNGKITWKINEKNTLRLSGYTGKDKFILEDSEIVLSDEIVWGNQTLSLLGRSEISKRLSLKSVLAYSGFGIDFRQDYRDYFVGLDSGLENLRFVEELQWQLSDKQTLRMGMEINKYEFKPYKINIRTGHEELNFGDSLPYKARDLSGYIDYRLNLSDIFVFQAGLRIMHSEHRSPFRRYLLNDNGFPVDSVYTSGNKTLASYTKPEPRLSLSLLLSKNDRIKISASHNNQTVHMVPLSTSSLPIDLWLPSTSLIKPQSSNSYSLGWFHEYPMQRIELSVEGFYRNMNNLVDFSEYQTIMGLVKNNMDQQMSFGTGKAYGIELFIRKNSGDYKGWIGYTLSKTRHTFPEINNGQPFAPRHDRLHDFNLFVTKKISEKWEGSIQFVYATGQPTTIPLSFYVLNGNVIQYFNDRNSIRLPAYHRFDIAFTKTPEKIKKYKSSWTFSIYNVYNRINPFFVYYDLSWNYEKNLLLSKGRKIGLLPLIPSLTWTMQF